MLCRCALNGYKCLRHKGNTCRVSVKPAMTGRRVIWIAIVFIIIGMTWGDPQPESSSTRQLPLQSVGLSDVDDYNDDNDMPLGAVGYIKMASIQSFVNTIESATRDAALVDQSHGSRAPPRAPAELIYRVVLLSLPTVFDRSEVCSASSLLGGSFLDTTESNTACLAVRRIGPVLMAKLNCHHIVSANREQDQVGAADRLHHRR